MACVQCWSALVPYQASTLCLHGHDQILIQLLDFWQIMSVVSGFGLVTDETRISCINHTCGQTTGHRTSEMSIFVPHYADSSMSNEPVTKHLFTLPDNAARHGTSMTTSRDVTWRQRCTRQP